MFEGDLSEPTKYEAKYSIVEIYGLKVQLIGGKGINKITLNSAGKNVELGDCKKNDNNYNRWLVLPMDSINYLPKVPWIKARGIFLKSYNNFY